MTALPPPQRSRRFILDRGMTPNYGAGFLINGQAFDPQRLDVQTTLGAIEDWELVNRAGMDRPFHLHVHPFQVLERDGQRKTLLAWRDTISVPAYSTAKLRVRFADLTGKSLYPGHILDGEIWAGWGLWTYNPKQEPTRAPPQRRRSNRFGDSLSRYARGKRQKRTAWDF